MDAGQRAFLDLVTGTVDRLRPAHLGAIEASTRRGTLVVVLPHLHDDEQTLTATVSADDAVVSYGYEHEHFDAGDDGDGWRVAAAKFVEQLLLGRVELEVRHGFLLQRTTSSWVDDAGEREVFLRGGTLLPSWRRGRKTVRFDFGVRTD